MPADGKGVAILWRGTVAERGAPEGFGRFTATAAALAEAGMAPEPCVYAEEFEAEVEAQLRSAAAVLVWVNPIHEGRDRARLDAMLRRVAALGVLVSAHPDAILAMGTKEVLYRTRAMPWGGDVRCYRTHEALRRELPTSLATGIRVLKQNRGHSGLGVWQVENAGAFVRVRHALRGSAIETISLAAFVERCTPFFDGGGLMIDQPYVPRLAEGMIRCYLIGTRIEGFGHQAVNALYPAAPGTPNDAMPPPGPRLYSGPDDPRFQHLRGLMEREWLPQLLDMVGMTAAALPALWDIDFMLGPRDASGQDSYVLCEINVSSVSPFPESALIPLALELRRRLT